MLFTSVLDPRAVQDIQEAIDYYDKQEPGLGAHFESVINDHILKIEQNPFFQVRYSTVHCLPVSNFPYMIHFTINEQEKIVTIQAILNTYRSPTVWRERDK